MADLDRILAGEPEIEPSSGFAAGVMGAVALTRTAPPPVPFPWWRVVFGSLACLTFALAGSRLDVSMDLMMSDPVTWSTVAAQLASLGAPLGFVALVLCLVFGGLGLQRELSSEG